jgi:hypothetical protein
VFESRNADKLKKTKLHGLSPRANYTDRATAACRRSDCQLLRIEGADKLSYLNFPHSLQAKAGVHIQSTLKHPDFIVLSGSKEYRYGLITDKYQPHNTKFN